MVTLKDCDIVICTSTSDVIFYSDLDTVFYVVIGGNMVSLDRIDCREVGTELPADCVRVYRPKHIANTFNGNYRDDRLYDCLYAKDHPSLVKTNT